MTLSLTAKALGLAALALTVLANPLDTLSTRQATDGCAVVRCRDGYTCQVIDGSAQCVPIPQDGTVCGPNICGKGLQCCNASCGICLPPGMACTQQACIGPQCGSNTCQYGDVCCNASCGTCTPPGGMCTQQFCETGPKCGNNTCGSGEVCCNASCGICTKPGGVCTQQVCNIKEPVLGVRCGTATCGAGQFCCNASCSTCAPRGGACTQQICPELATE